jgi:hypothetical protein
MKTERYLPVVLREFEGMKRLADKAIAQLSDEQVFATIGEGDNSVAVLMKHVSGNLRSRWTDFLTTDGDKPDRKRDEEFIIRADDTRDKLHARWEAGWAVLFSTLKSLGPADLDGVVTIRSEPLTVLEAINRQLTHYAYHVGQIVLLAKHRAGSRWQTLSIPVGESESFNRAPHKYIQSSDTVRRADTP